MQSGVLNSISSRQHSVISGRPLHKWTDDDDSLHKESVGISTVGL